MYVCVCACVSCSFALSLSITNTWHLCLYCRCKKGFYGPRCATPELVGRPMDEEQVVVILFCVTLLMIGLGGALYFFYKW